MPPRRDPAALPKRLPTPAKTLRAKTPRDDDAQMLVQELQVHQIELELQNEELRRTQLELETARERLRLAYDAAPVGFLTLDAAGVIREANLAAARLLNLDRAKLAGQKLTRFIAPESQDVLYLSRRQLFSTGEKQTCEVRLVGAGGGEFAAQLEAVVAPAAEGQSPGCLVVLSVRTERETADRALAESRALKRAIIDSTTDLIWSVDTKGFRMQTFNRSLQEFFRTNRGIRLEVGLRPEDLFQRHETDFVERWKALYQRALDSGSFTTEYATYAGANTLLLTFCPLRREDEVFGVSVFGRDITERKRAEEALEHSRRLLAESEKMGKLGSWELDTLNLKVTWTETVYAIHELDPACPPSLAEAVGFYTPACRPMIERAVQRAMELGEPYDLELQIVTAKGGHREVHTIGHADLAQHKIFGFIQDITAQKQAEQTLRESEETLSKMFQSSPVAISLSTLGEGRLLEVNEEYLRMVERTREQVIGRTSHELGLWVDPAQRTGIVDQLSRQPSLRNIELDLRAKSGRVNHVLWSGEALVIHGERCLLGSALDITERKHTEIELQCSERALKTISACDQALVHATTEAELLQQICRVIVESGGYPMAWVGFAESDAAKTVRVAAVAGHETNYLAEVTISWSATDEHGRGPTGEAIRSGQTIVCQDTQTDPRFAPWRDAARQRGYASSISLPLRHAGSTFGILMIYAAETQAFQTANVALLTTLSEDLAYGIQALRTRRQHQQAEAALRANEARFRAIFNTNAVATAIVEPDSTISLVNEVYCQAIGYTRSEMTGQSWKLLVVPEDLERLTEYYRRRLLNPQDAPEQYEFRFQHKNGEVRHCQIAVAVIPATGQVVASMLDITARKRMEESHARLATAIEQSAETVVITDTQGAILYANPAFEKTSGYTRAEALGQNPRVLKSGKHDADFYRHMWATLQRGEVWSGHVINKRKDGTLYEEDASISPMRDSGGAVINYVAVKRDVTHEVQLEAQVRQSQKLEAIGTLAGGIAHDFNNMLGAMFGYAHLLQQDTEGNPLAQESVEEILKAANRAKELVQQILTFSRQRESSRQVIRLDGIIKEAMKFLRASLPANLKIAMQLAPATPAVLADATQIYQVTMNLATNAVHAMEGRNGQLTVALEPFQPDAAFIHTHPQSRPIPYARLTLADTGHGMDAKTLARMYEPFFTTKPVGKGTGLGLSVVHGIMESHDGIITVESQVGQGTTFRLYFPAQTQTETVAVDAGKVHPARGRSQRILLLDDEAALTSVLQKMLRRLNYQVTTSNHGGEAIRLVRENPAQFDLLITDLTMPELNGVEVARQIHALQPALRVILVTGNSDALDANCLSEAGIRELLQKPLSMAALAEAVQRVLCLAS